MKGTGGKLGEVAASRAKGTRRLRGWSCPRCQAERQKKKEREREKEKKKRREIEIEKQGRQIYRERERGRSQGKQAIESERDAQVA